MVNDSLFHGKSREELLTIAKGYSWVHSIDLGGVVTEGLWGSGNPMIARAIGELDLSGAKVLDIGTWDGLYAFQAEDRGASEIWATDLISQRDFASDRTFQLAAALRGSRANYLPDLSVYDVESLGISDFDFVIFTGVYYHLKDPLRALTALRNVMSTGAQVLVEGAILQEDGCHARFYYRDSYCHDNSNWWVPTTHCLREWVECSFFDIEVEYEAWDPGGNPRACLVGRATHGGNERYSRPPEGLEQFMA